MTKKVFLSASSWEQVPLPTPRGEWDTSETLDVSTLSLSENQGVTFLTVSVPTVSGNPANVLNEEWLSEPLSAAFTISGTVTLNFWMAESHMAANVGARCVINKVNSLAQITQILDTSKGTELPVTTRAAQNWTDTPTSTDFAKGDRLLIQVYGTNIGTMNSGHSFNISMRGSAGADGDSWVQFNENLTFDSASWPSTTTF